MLQMILILQVELKILRDHQEKVVLELNQLFQFFQQKDD